MSPPSSCGSKQLVKQTRPFGVDIKVLREGNVIYKWYVPPPCEHATRRPLSRSNPIAFLITGYNMLRSKKSTNTALRKVRVRSIPPWLSGERKRREKRASELAAFITWETRDVTLNHMRAAIGPGWQSSRAQQ
jgi:hypothetical protein